MSFEGSGVLVTGAGAGIGRATALHLASLGARVVVSDISDEGAKGTVEEILGAGGQASAVVADVADAASVDELIARSVEYLGGLDLAVNNAGIGHHPGDLHEMPIEVWDQVMGIDLRGTFLCLRAELKVMVEAGHGSIVNMASNAGLKNAPDMAAYTTAKHGVIGLTKNAALTYARRNIRVNAVCPGTIATPGMASFPAETQREWANLIPMGRLGTPEEVAQAVAYLLSDQAAFITGIGLLIDGGLMYA
ncbi:NAD(P)-dependent dehydrogenase (short-subunit alcohol dehydrogenase family) [Actinoplanes tereljensis]|uniref:Short chain dehydrogenase n=1 Tax=Paractinoplanes tereljensis TaxID=571912 RepID=A0A919NZD2_9ACTN|nr:SDR family NAD(P)-dependent oxidoreductase [Actinoplanes tereljensis]GIF26726.1 short chain dehydrogenase [Actinoplanes tereljensis]